MSDTGGIRHLVYVLADDASCAPPELRDEVRRSLLIALKYLARDPLCADRMIKEEKAWDPIIKLTQGQQQGAGFDVCNSLACEVAIECVIACFVCFMCCVLQKCSHYSIVQRLGSVLL